LPERFDDLIFRIDTLYHDERGGGRSSDYIYIFEDNNEIIGIILPDGDSFNSAIKEGYENIFDQMLDLAEKALLPLFEKDENGKTNFLVVSHDSLDYQAKELEKRGYVKDEAGGYDNVQHPSETNYIVELPVGYKQTYGEGIEDNKKAKACHYGFHPTDDDGVLTREFREGKLSYQGRKQSQFFKDSFESLVVTNDGDICSYCFCYVNKNTNTAFIEPVCTREKYQKRGFARQMLYGVINRLKEMKIESVYINSYDWRKKVYNSVGFKTEDSIGF
jgi:predicted GNAT family acetyltransferase